MENLLCVLAKWLLMHGHRFMIVITLGKLISKEIFLYFWKNLKALAKEIHRSSEHQGYMIIKNNTIQPKLANLQQYQ